MSAIANRNVETGMLPANIRWGWGVAAGVLLIVVGFVAFAQPFVSTVAVELFLGWVLLFGGAVQLFHVFKSKNHHHKGSFALSLLSAVLTIAAGFVLLAYPLRGVLTLTLILATFFFIEGICNTIRAFQIRPRTGWGWMCFSGVIEVVFSAMIWSQWPTSAVWLLGMLVAFDLMFAGWSIIALSLTARALNQNPLNNLK